MRSPNPLQRLAAGRVASPTRCAHQAVARTALDVVVAAVLARARLLAEPGAAGAGSVASERDRRFRAAGGFTPDVATLVYELRDAHDDTAAIASELAQADIQWERHLAYLRSLQRTGREALAHLSAEEVR